MRKILTLVAVGFVCSSFGLLRADDKGSKVTLKGEGLCAKCGLKEKDAKTCQNVVIVKKGEKETKYYLTGDLSKAAHQKLGFCGASKDEPVKVEVVGTCEKKGDKLVVTVTEPIKKQD